MCAGWPRLGWRLQENALAAAVQCHVCLTLFDIGNEDGLPFHLRVFALRLLMWVSDRNVAAVEAQVAAYAGDNAVEKLLLK
jgi:hypothetical protein